MAIPVPVDTNADAAPSFQVYCQDAVEWLRTLPDQSVDLIITDPPYESLEKYRKRGTTTRLKHSKSSSNDWFAIFPNARFAELFAELFRVLRHDRHLYMLCDAATMFVAKPIAEAAGFLFWKPLVWDKVEMGMGYHYRARHEFVLLFEKERRKRKGKKRLMNDFAVTDIITANRVHRGYPTEKPVELLRVLVAQSTQRGEFVIDPFMGVGSAGVAAIELGRRFAGNDIVPDAVLKAAARMRVAGGTEVDNIFAAVDVAEPPRTQ